MSVRTDETASAGGREGPKFSAPLSLTPLTGRETEVGLLQDRWEQAQEGLGQVVVVVGEAGLGKSRLVQTIKQLVLEAEREGGPAVMEWRCAARFQNTGLYPVADYLRRVLNFGSEETTTEQFNRLAAFLDELGMGREVVLSLMAKLLFLPVDERYAASGLTPIREREELFRALWQWIRAEAERRPFLFVIEDLHWIDASTLEFLVQFIAEGRQERILTLLTMRPEFTPPWPPVPHQTTLRLNPLTRRLVAELMRKSSSSALPDTLVTQVYQRTRGVPLLVEEFSRMWLEVASSEATGEERKMQPRDLPTTLQALVLARLDHVGSQREVAHLAATLGREFSFELLAAVSGRDEATLVAELGKLVHAGILHLRGESPLSRYLFKHALLEEALRGALSEAEGRALHARVAETVEAHFPTTVARQPELLAHHFTEAGLAEKAIAYWLQAALRSQERFAIAEAIAHLQKGLALLETLEPSPARDERELELLGPLGTAYIASHGYAAPEVGPIFERARALCERVGEGPLAFAMMWGDFAFHVVRGDFRLCAQLGEAALAYGDRLGDPGMLMEGLFLRGLTMFYRGDFAGAAEMIERALTQYDDRARTAYLATLIGEDPGVTCRCYLALAQWHLGRGEQALALSRETVELARSLKQPFSLEYALHHAGWLAQNGRWGALAQAAGSEQIQIAAEQGFTFWQATGTLYRGAGLVLQERVEDGLVVMRKGLEAYRATGARLALPCYLGLLGEACLKAGRFEEARAALAEALALVEENDERCHEAELLRLHGELALAAVGDAAGAEQWFRRALETAREQKSKAWELRATMSLARLWRGQNRPAEAYMLLSATRAAFTEGADAPDLLAAGALIEDWSNETMRQEFAAGVKYVRDCIPTPIEGALSVDWRYQPATTLGGDTIGYHWIDEDHLALYLVDVTGHGLDSALLSVSISNVLRSGSLTATDLQRPGEVLGKLNDAFPGRQHGSKFFTIWYGVYGCSRKELYWAGGGHHAAILLVNEEAEPVLLPSTGPMMGVVSGAKYESCSQAIPPGARLLIFSDGVFEIRRDRQEMWDFEGCISFVAGMEPSRASFGDELLRRAQELRGSPQLDDDFSVIEARFGG